MNLRTYSEWLVGMTLLTWLAWTVLVYRYGRPGDTISCVIMDFCNTRATFGITCLAVGYLMGHWTWPIVVEVHN